MTGPVLILGGTAEGRELAAALTVSSVSVISSLAGRVNSPRLPPGAVRVGGFGGADGLAKYLSEQAISMVVDATHPFAGRITGNAQVACARTGTRLLVVRRPAWTAVSGDRWTSVADLPATVPALTRHGRDAAVLLTVGRQGASTFSQAPQRFWLRAVDPPEGPLPTRVEVILDRGPFTVTAERDLMLRLGIDVLVTKNSGGDLTVAKLTAARALGLPVIMVARPPLPAGVTTVDSAAAALSHVLPSV